MNNEHCCPMKSNERAMEKWPLVHTVLKTSPMIKTGKLESILRGHISRSDLYEFLNVYEQRNMIIRPTRGLINLVSDDKHEDNDSFGLFKWLRDRRERKRLEEEKQQKELLARKWTYCELVAKRFGDEARSLKEWVEIEKKNYKELGLSDGESES